MYVKAADKALRLDAHLKLAFRKDINVKIDIHEIYYTLVEG